nr:hypothetical protein [Tanacetum cinerariifolium]
GAIRKLTDVNINKLHQPWRSFAAIINKCLTGKSSSYDSLRSQAQILWRLYHKRNVDFAYLIWEDFVYQVKHKDTKKSNERYYPRFTKVIIHHFMSKDYSIPRRNKVNWHYVRDDHIFSTIKLVSRYQNTQQFGALLLIELTNEDIRNSNAYKEYYVVATGAAPPKPKASVRKTRSSSDTTITPPTAAAGPRLTTSEKGKQAAKASKAKSLSALSEVLDVPIDESEEELSWNSTDEEGDDDEGKDGDGDEEDDGRGIQTTLEVEDSHVTLTLVNPDGQQQNSSMSSQFVTSMLNPTLDVGMESIFKTTSQMGAQTPTSVAPLLMYAPTITPYTIATIKTTQQAPLPPITTLSTLLQDLPNFGSLFGFDNRLKTLEAKLFKFMQTNQFLGFDYLRDEAQKENDEFLKTIDENMQKIIKEQVKEQVKVQVSKILPKIEQTVNKQLEAKVLTRSSYSSKTSYAVAADLSEMKLKKILIEKIEGNKRRDDDADKDEEPFVGSDWGSKRRREGKEPESASAPKEKATRSAGKSTRGTKSRQASESKSAIAEDPMQTTFQMEEPSHLEFDTGVMKKSGRAQISLRRVYKATTDQLDRVNPEGQQYPHNVLKPLPLIPNNQGRRVIPFEHFINNDLEYLHGGASSRKYTNSVTKTKAADYGHIKWIKDLEPLNYDKHALWGVSHWGRKHQQFYGFAVNRESALDVYSKWRIIVVTDLKIVEWHNYKNLDWTSIRRDNDKIYKFKEGDFKRLRLQDIEDMLLLLVQGKLSNLTVEEHFAFNVSLRMFTRSIVIQRCVEDL